MAPFDSEIPAQRVRTISPLPSSRTPLPASVGAGTSNSVVDPSPTWIRIRRLEVGPWSLDVVAYAVAVLLRGESGCRPLPGIDPKTRALDVLVIDDLLAVPGRDVVAARVIRNFDDFPEELIRLRLPGARIPLKKVLVEQGVQRFLHGPPHHPVEVALDPLIVNRDDIVQRTRCIV